MFVPGLPEASTNGPLLLGTKQAAWDAIAALFDNDIAVSPLDAIACLFSRESFTDLTDGFSEADYFGMLGLIAPAITDTAVVGNLASQRNRRARRNTFG